MSFCNTKLYNEMQVVVHKRKMSVEDAFMSLLADGKKLLRK